jgi:hypothetical protein
VIKLRLIKWAGHVACIGKMKNAYNISIGKPDGKSSLGRCRHRWEDNIRMYLRKQVGKM